jgi:hypothetical protein
MPATTSGHGPLPRRLRGLASAAVFTSLTAALAYAFTLVCFRLVPLPSAEAATRRPNHNFVSAQ